MQKFIKTDELIKKGFVLHSWNDRYGKGVWVVLAPPALSSTMFESVEYASSAGDLDMIPATDYYLSTTWLPIVVNNSVVESLVELENRLYFVTPSNLQLWVHEIEKIVEDFERISGASDYGGMEGNLPKLERDWRPPQ
jgi:hypothetical protein